MPKPISVSSIPEMMAMWDDKENQGIDPSTILVSSENIYAWKHLGMNHSFHSSPRIIRHGHGCSVCARKEVLEGYNDLFSCQKELCNEWDYERNIKGPEKYTEHSGEYVYWKCGCCGYGWRAQINSRSKGTGCPNCSSSKQTSFPEQAILYYIKKYCTHPVESHYRFDSKYTIDIFIRKLRIAIEYDGYAWHGSEKAKKREIYKADYCKENTIRLIHIKEQKAKAELNVVDDTIAYFRDKHDDSLNDVIYILLTKILMIKTISRSEINVIRDKNLIYRNYKLHLVENSIAVKFPQLVEEWDERANFPLRPETTSYQSNDKIHWVCKKYKHSFVMSVDKRTGRNYQCPYCSGRKLLVGFNDFKTWCEENDRIDLLEEWDFPKEPSQYLKGNKSEQINWKCCRCGNNWTAPILTRVHGYKNCERCEKTIKYKRILKCDLDGTVICEYPSASRASEETGLWRAKIVNAVIDKTEYGGHLWQLSTI